MIDATHGIILLVLLVIIVLTTITIVSFSVANTNIKDLLDNQANNANSNNSRLRSQRAVVVDPNYDVQKLVKVPINPNLSLLYNVVYEGSNVDPSWVTPAYESDESWKTNNYALDIRCERMYNLLSNILFFKQQGTEANDMVATTDTNRTKRAITTVTLEKAVQVVNAFAYSLYEYYVLQRVGLILNPMSDTHTLATRIMPFISKYLQIMIDDPNYKLFGLQGVIEVTLDKNPSNTADQFQSVYTGFAYILGQYFSSDYAAFSNQKYLKCKENALSLAEFKNDVSGENMTQQVVHLFDGTFAVQKFTTLTSITDLYKFGAPFYQFIGFQSYYDSLLKSVFKLYCHPTIPAATFGLFSNGITADDLIVNTVNPSDYAYGVQISAIGKLMRIATASSAFFYRIIMPNQPFMRNQYPEMNKCLQYFTQYLGVRTADTVINLADNAKEIGFIRNSTKQDVLPEAYNGYNTVLATTNNFGKDHGLIYTQGTKTFMTNRVSSLCKDLENVVYTITVKYDSTEPQFITIDYRAVCLTDNASFVIYGTEPSISNTFTTKPIELQITHNMETGVSSTSVITPSTWANLNKTYPEYAFDLSDYTIVTLPQQNGLLDDYLILDSNSTAGKPVIYCNSNVYSRPMNTVTFTYNSTTYTAPFDNASQQYLVSSPPPTPVPAAK